MSDSGSVRGQQVHRDPPGQLRDQAAIVGMIVQADVRRVDGVRRDPDGVRRLITSYARNVGTDAALRIIGRTAEEPLSEPTLHDYLGVLRRLFFRRPELLAAAPPFACAFDGDSQATPRGSIPDGRGLGGHAGPLVGPEIELAWFLFESQVIHDLRVCAEPDRASVRFYRDNKGLEVDAVVEARDGRWIAVEVKLGHHGVEEGAQNLVVLHKKLADDVRAPYGALLVVVAESPTYIRPDGVVVTSVAAMGP